jgi:iron complex transport system substrate-binding protein
VADLPVCTKPRIAVDGDSREIDRLVKEQVAQALSVYEVFDDVLERLQPTHILTQTQCEVCAVSLRDVELSAAARLASKPRIVPLQPNSLADIRADIRRVAASTGVEDAGESLIGEMDAAMDEISGHAREAQRRPRVACIEWIEPLMAAGNWVPELVELANGQNLFGEPGTHSPWMSWEELVAARPDVVIAMPCGFDLARTQSEMHWLTRRPDWGAIANRVYLADGNQYFNRPGPRIVESLRILAEILHPGLFAPEMEGAAWRRFA